MSNEQQHFQYRDQTFHVYVEQLKSKADYEFVMDAMMSAIDCFDGLKENSYTEPYYCEMYLYVNGELLEEEEQVYYASEAFWGRAAQIPECFEKAEEFLQYCIQKVKSDKYKFWESEELQIGELPAYFLSLKDKRFIKYFADLLHHWDMGHEVYQAEFMDKLVELHQWCPEIHELIIARATSDGQHNFEQLQELETFITNHAEPLEENTFFIELVNRVQKFWGKEVQLWQGEASQKDIEYVFGKGKMGQAAWELVQQE